EGRTHVRPSDDEVYTPSPRRSEGRHGQLGGSLFEPCREQNLYANPKRTAKSFVPLNEIARVGELFKKYFQKVFHKFFGLSTAFSVAKLIVGDQSTAKSAYTRLPAAWRTTRASG